MYEGSRPSVNCLKPAVSGLESSLRAAVSLSELRPIEGGSQSSLELGRYQRIMWRLDGGFGSDDNLQHLLERNYQFMAKGFSGRRANKLAQQVRRWTPFGDVWLGQVSPPIESERELLTWVKRRYHQGNYQHSYYLTTRKYSALTQSMRAYNQRGSAEIEQFRNDKQGLHLSAPQPSCHFFGFWLL